VTPARAALIGAALLLGAAPARAQHCRLDFVAGLGKGPGAGVCSELASTSSSVSLWVLPGLASSPSVYDALLDAIQRIPRQDGLRGWATAEAAARIATPSIGRVTLLGEFGAIGLARLDLPARSLDYFRSDTLADSLYWSFDGLNGVGVVFRSVGGGALIEVARGFSVGAMVRYLEAEALVGGRVAGGVLESFDGLDVDLDVAEYRRPYGSGTSLGLLARLTGDRFRAGLSVERIGATPRLRVQNRVREADSTYQSTRDAVDALGPTRTLSETVEVGLPMRASLSAGHALGPRTWLWVDSHVTLSRDFPGANRIGARILTRPASWLLLDAGGGWSSGIDASIGLGVAAGPFTWKLEGLSALNGRNMRLATRFAVQ
jgi:hypothetical protein